MTTVGFTGTRQGMTKKQADTFRSVIKELNPSAFHHGDCLGADAQAHDIVRDVCAFRCRIYIHPSTYSHQRAFRRGHYIFDQLPPLERNHKIVDNVGSLIATPYEENEQLRSGTWATIRYARRAHKRVLIINPDGIQRIDQ